MRKFIEKLVEGGFLISGSVSSFTILLIIVFLFKEAAGLFNSPEVEEGYILAVNQENPVEHLSPEQIMDVFDANITNWEDLNGENQDILVFRFSDLTNYRILSGTIQVGELYGKNHIGSHDQTFGVLWRDEMVSYLRSRSDLWLDPSITRHTFSKYRCDRLIPPLRSSGSDLYGRDCQYKNP